MCDKLYSGFGNERKPARFGKRKPVKELYPGLSESLEVLKMSIPGQNEVSLNCPTLCPKNLMIFGPK